MDIYSFLATESQIKAASLKIQCMGGIKKEVRLGKSTDV